MPPLSDDYTLTVRQGPERAKLASIKEKERKPVDPPPIIQLFIRDPQDPAQNYLQSPYLFMCANLCEADPATTEPLATQGVLSGTLVSSLHRLKDLDNSDGGFFVFGDLSVRVEGTFRLRFSLFEMFKSEVVYIKSVLSARFTVQSGKSFPGMLESTFLSRAFGDQGVRLRIRKEPRTLTWVLDNSSHSAWLTGHTGCRKRTAPSLRPEDVPVAFEDPPPASQPRAALQSQRHSMGMGVFNYRRSEMGEPSMKRQRTSVDLGERDLYDTERYSQRPYMQQRGSYGAYPTRDQTSNIYQSAYSQGPPSALGNVSDYSLGHQRTNSSSTSSPFVSPHTEVSGHSWSGANIYYQPPMKETSYSYNPNQYSDMQFGRQNQNQNQLAEPFQRQRSYNMPSSDMASQNMASQNMASQNVASQNLTSRLPVATNFQYARTQEGESNSAIGMYGHISRSLPSTSSMQDPPPRLPSTDQLADYMSPNRQQYHDLQGNNTLPPIDANFGSSQIIREGSQQMHHAVLPSIENHTMLSNAGQSVSDEHGQEGYDGQGGYDSSAFNYPPLASHKGLDDG